MSQLPARGGELEALRGLDGGDTKTLRHERERDSSVRSDEHRRSGTASQFLVSSNLREAILRFERPFLEFC